MIKWILAVLGLQLAGEVAATLLHLPVPGPLLGMLLLFGLLMRSGGPSPALQRLSDSLLKHLYLFFIPAAVGVTAHVALIRSQLGAILVAVIASSALAMLVSGLLMQRFGAKDDGNAV